MAKKIRKPKSKLIIPKIFVPSRGRAEIGLTWKLFPEANVMVLASERRAYADVLGDERVYTTRTKGITPARNMILDTVKPGKWVMMFDDDIKTVGQFVLKRQEKYKQLKMDAKDWWEKICAAVTEADKRGFHLVGVQPTTNTLNYKGVPYKTNMFINGTCFCAKVVDGIRFDSACRVKEDYEYTARIISEGLGVMRIEYLWYNQDYRTLEGGCNSWRKDSHDEEAAHYLIAKYPRLISMHTRLRKKCKFEIMIRAPRKRKKK